MGNRLLVYQSRVRAPAAAVFQWHARQGAFQRLSPPWKDVELVADSGGIAPGSRKVVSMSVGPLRQRWVAEHREWVPGREFSDVQVEGPFALWEHRHLFEPDGNDSCILEDRVEYKLPLGSVGDWVAGRLVDRQLSALFAYRHRVTCGDLALHRRYSRLAPQRVLVSGASGLVGSTLTHFLRSGGHEVTRLVRVRRPPEEKAVYWNSITKELHAPHLEGHNAVVHLAGESIALRRWNETRKARIHDSRVEGTLLLCSALSKLARPPRVLISASAIGYYGSREDQLLDEDSAAGKTFLAAVSQAWEEAARTAERAGIRVVLLRTGVVLSPSGGALAKILLPFRWGAGGVAGPGNQFMSWISLDDLLGAILHCLATEDIRGPVNAVAPTPVRNRDFTRVLGTVLRRPALLPAPAKVLKLALGELADELLLASLRVDPGRLRSTGYEFLYPEVESALRHMLGKEDASSCEVRRSRGAPGV